MSERKIDEATMDNVEILAKLALTPQERQKAMDEMEKILTYVEKLMNWIPIRQSRWYTSYRM